MVKKVTGFQIMRVKAKGFKKFDKEICFEFGGLTSITGGNRQGKSTIPDIVSYVFTGATFAGEQKGLDRLKNDSGDGSMSATVDYITDTGELHSITRSRSKNDSTELTFDGYDIRQTDLDEMFGGVHVFLGIINPLYLIDIASNKAAEVLGKLLPVVKHEAVLAELSEHTRELLRNEPLLSPETYQKSKRQEIRELESELVKTVGMLELQEEQTLERESKLSKINHELSQITETLAGLEAAKGPMPDSDDALEALIRQRDELSAQLENDPELVKLGDEQAGLTMELSEVQAGTYENGSSETLSTLLAEKSVLEREYSELAARIKDMRPGTQCPACKRLVTGDNLSEVVAELKASLSEVVQRGKAKAQEYMSLKEEIDIGSLTFEDDKEQKLAALQERLESVSVSLQASTEKLQNKLRLINDRIISVAWIKENGYLDDEQIAEYRRLRERKSALDAQVAAISAVQPDDMLSNQKKRLEEDIRKQQELLKAVETYAAERSKLMFGSLPLNKTGIMLTEVAKTTGEVRDTFRFTYDGRDYRNLSLSERICTGLEICELVKSLTGREYPTFVDNYESIEQIENVTPTGQYILLSVKKKAELTVTALSPITYAPLEAAA